MGVENLHYILLVVVQDKIYIYKLLLEILGVCSNNVDNSQCFVIQIY